MTESKSKAKAAAEAEGTADTTPKDHVTEDSATPEKGGVKSSGPIGDFEEPKSSDGKVEVKLAHPITKDADKVRLGLDPETKCNVNDTLRVTRDDALRLINAGLVQVDPEDAGAVHKAVYGG